MSRTLRIATCQYKVGVVASWDAFAQKLDLVLGEAKRGGADLALLPEYFTMELATMFAASVRESLDVYRRPPNSRTRASSWVRKSDRPALMGKSTQTFQPAMG